VAERRYLSRSQQVEGVWFLDSAKRTLIEAAHAPRLSGGSSEAA
jgi:hypothetical protein